MEEAVMQQHAHPSTVYHCLCAHIKLGYTRNHLAHIFNKTEHTIGNWLQTYYETGVFQHEARDAFRRAHGTEIFKTSVCRIIHSLGLTWKVLERRAIHIKELDVFGFVEELDHINWSHQNLVFLDEVSFDNRGMVRKDASNAHLDNMTDFDALDQVDPFYMALLRSRQRRFADCIDICTDILAQNPYDQAAWVTKTKAMTMQNFIDDSELEEDGAADLLMDDNVMASMPRPGTSLNRPNSRAGTGDPSLRPMTSTGRPLSGFARPGTSSRSGTGSMSVDRALQGTLHCDTFILSTILLFIAQETLEFNTSTMAPCTTRNSSTYALQTSLPRLPVPSLQATLDKYLRSLEPLVTKVEFEKTMTLVQEFGKSGGEGERLQAELLQRANDRDNWLAEWWEQVAYLSDPTPNALFVNMVTGFGSFQDFERPVSQARRAAETVRYTCEYLERLKREQVPPEMMGGRVLCMNMFRRLFSTCRIPEKPTDRFKRVDPATVRHITVFCEGRVFLLPVYDAENEVLTIGDLEVQLLHILRHSAYLNSLPATKRNDGDLPQFVGALTAMRRDKWAETRQVLVDFDPLNERSLDKIETSLFALCLESTTPGTPSELARQCAASNAGNRWFDKSFQYLVFANGMVGANMEHANADATVLQSMFRWLGERYLNRNGGY
ncbi:Choline/Carnitine O-acyltransferase, partial [Phytophthora palmivora]